MSSEECAALAVIHNKLGPQSVLTNWTTTIPNEGFSLGACCSWLAVSCNTAKDAVQVLGLYGEPLTGTIPTEIGRLTKLTRLALLGTHLKGTIPTEVFDLTEMTVVVLDRNSLWGAIPTNIGKLTKLEALYLSSNFITGPIPTELAALGLSFCSLFPNPIQCIPSNLPLVCRRTASLLSSVPTSICTTSLSLSNLPTDTSNATVQNITNNQSTRIEVILGSVFGSVALLIVIGLVIRRRKLRQESSRASSASRTDSTSPQNPLSSSSTEMFLLNEGFYPHPTLHASQQIPTTSEPSTLYLSQTSDHNQYSAKLHSQSPVIKAEDKDVLILSQSVQSQSLENSSGTEWREQD